MTRLAPALALAAVALIGTAATASATKPPATGHTPIVVCHNVTHNPHIIVVDDDSTKLHAHLAHRTQSQLMDLVEGYDGTAAQIRAACVPKPTPTTIPTTVTPSPTNTGSTPSATTTTPSSTTTSPSSSTSSTSTTSVPSASSSTASPSPSPTSSTPTTPTKTTASSTSPAAPPKAPSTHSTGSTQPSSPTAASPRRSVPSSTVAPPELAMTGAGLGLAGIGAVLLAAGIALSRKVRRGEH